MIKALFKRLIFIASVLYFQMQLSCNNKERFKDPYNNIGGYVIGAEVCNTNATENYWLLDFTVYTTYPHIGDTLFFNGTRYTNVLKVKGLDERLKQIGMKVSIDYDKVSTAPVITKGCTAANPITYSVKELFIINQFEIR